MHHAWRHLNKAAASGVDKVTAQAYEVDLQGNIQRLVERLNYGIIGNGHAINRFYRWAMDCTFKWLNRRGGKRNSFTWEVFWRAVKRGLFHPPRIVVGVKRKVNA